MNIDDVEIGEAPRTIKETLEAMFDRQRTLMAKYSVIEKENGANVPSLEFCSLQDAKRQWRIKEDFWRATEEIAEAWEHFESTMVAMSDWRNHFETDASVRHIFEELADAFHFLIEATIHSGHGSDSLNLPHVYENVYASSLPSPIKSYESSFQFIRAMGLAANELKNKPWKQTQMETDADRYRRRLVDVWHFWFRVWAHLDARFPDFYDLYFRKSEVNKFRQRSKY